MPAAKKAAATASAAKKPIRKKNESKPEPTHEVLRTVVIDGYERSVGDLVHLDGLNAAELESHGYVRAHRG